MSGFFVSLAAQQVHRVGSVIDARTRQPIAMAQVEIAGMDIDFHEFSKTDKDGSFEPTSLPFGLYSITATAEGYEPYSFEWNYAYDVELPALVIALEPIRSVDPRHQDMADLYVEDLSIDEGVDTQETAPMLTASRDPYTNTAGYTFSPVRFRVRGYDSQYQSQLLNGLHMNDMNNGYSAWSLWGGLNDAVRNQETVLNTETSDFTFGNIGGAVNIDTRASGFRRGHRLSASLSNRTYTTRLMYTYATGLLKNGWAFAFSGSRRWGSGNHSYVLGQNYDAWGYFLSLEKQFGDKHALSLTGFAAPVSRGVASGTTQEAYDLVGSNFYNPNVGMQNGKWRNARVRHSHEPIINLVHYWQMSDAVKMTTAVGYRFGYNAYASLDWANAPDPRPDYYRYLPSYYTDMTETPDPATAEYLAMLWQSDQSVRYINWQSMYDANRENYQRLYDAQGNLIAEGRRSEYAQVDRRTDQQQFNAAITVNALLSDKIKLDAGANVRNNRTYNFQVMRDLLGGDFWYDIDKFADRDFGDPISAQLDLRNPNPIVKEGDRMGYNYVAHNNSFEGWAVLRGTFNYIDAYAGASVGMSFLQREGKQQRGLFPDNSLGMSDLLSFLEYSAKAGITYKISGHHYLAANVAIAQNAPYFRDVFISPRTRNSYVKDSESEKIYSGDISYHLRLPWLRGRATAFYTLMKDGMRNSSFYDDGHKAFSNYLLTGIDTKSAGVEIGLEAKISPTLTATGVFTWGHYVYDSNPDFLQTVDNSEKILANERIYWEGFNTAGTPQVAASLGLTYYSPWYMNIGANVNYFGRSFIDMNPVRRTDQAREQLDPKYIERETFGEGVTLDAFVSYSWRLKQNMYLRFNLSVTNILNNKQLKSGGYEQLRVRYTKETNEMMRPFDSKYFYANGTNFFFNVSLQF